MDVSMYYDSFQSIYNWAFFAVVFTFFAVVFCCIRTILDKSKECRPIWRKIIYCLGYMCILAVVAVYFMMGPHLMKKDIDQQTIYGYEGEFEIIELIPGLTKKAVFLIDGEKVCLEYFTHDVDYDYELIEIGKYEGKIIYSKYLGEILDIDTDTESLK